MTIFLVGCTTDAYDKGEGEYSWMQAQMADVHTGGDKRVDYFDTDDGDHIVVEPRACSWMQTADSVYRAVVYFSQNSQQARIHGFNSVGVARPRAFKDMKTDPVRFESAWMSKSGRYLNASLYLMLGSTTDDKAVHRLGCRRDTLIANADGTRTQFLTIYHDQGGIPEYYSQRVFVSMPLDSISADSVCLNVNTYNGKVVKRLRVKGLKGYY